MHSPNNKSVTVAAIQLSCGQTIQENVERAESEVRRAAAQGAEIICLQELFASQYFCQSECHDHFQLAEPIPGPLTQQFCALAKELQIVLILPLFERRAAGVYHNSAVVIETTGEIVGHYRKMHIPDDPSYYEKFYFTPGDLGFRSFTTSKAAIGVCICWDQWFPEAARLTALAGAEILFYPTAIGWLVEEKEEFGESQVNAWQTMMRSHAIANGVFVAAPNRVGTEGGIEFWGNSFISDPYGNMIAQAPENLPENAPATIAAKCDFSLVDTARTHWPFLRDRRIDAYSGLTKRMLDDG